MGPKQVSTKVYFIVLGSSIVTRRCVRSSGNALADGWSEPFLQKAGFFGAAHRRRQPDPAFLVDHGVVVIGLGVPDLLVAPIGRRPERLGHRGVPRSKRFGRVRIAHRRLEGGDLVGLGIEDRHHVGGVFGRAEERAVGVDRRDCADPRRSGRADTSSGRPSPRS